MTNPNRQCYDLHINTPAVGEIKAAEVILIEEGHNLSRFGFRYAPDYLNHPHSFALDPVQLPLMANEFNLACLGGIPGILDDYLPDDWGKKVLARLALYRDQQKLNSNSCIEVLSVLGDSRIGAVQLVPPGESPSYSLGCELNKITLAEQAAQFIDQPGYYSEHIDELSLLYLANSGIGIGGARPKALIHDQGQAYLAKFNRLNQDEYNNARIEIACLLMAKQAGLEVRTGRVESGINGRELLLLERFDVATQGENDTRFHLVTVNAMLKEPASQKDRGGGFRYDDIAELIRLHSMTPEKDLQQLLRLMLFNRAINNLDTHERNFSFIVRDNGYQLSPAYDMVPSLTVGAYPVAGYQYSPVPPLVSEALTHGKIFGLPKTQVKIAADQVAEAVKNWRYWAQQASVSDEDTSKIERVLML